MDIELVKKFLRIDTNDEDEEIKLLIDVAEEYVAGAIGRCDTSKARTKLLMLTLISTLYQNRNYTMTGTDKGNEKAQYTMQTIMMQLGLEGEDGD